MIKIFCTVYCLMLMITVAHGQETDSATNVPQETSSPLLLTHLNYIDVIHGSLKSDQDILIQDQVITQVGPSGSFEVPDEVQTMNLEGKYVLPGLIDAHVHLFQSGGLYTRPDAMNLQSERSYDEEMTWIRDQLETTMHRYVKNGITTIVDVGGPMYNYTIREKFANDPHAPNYFVTGPLVSTYQPAAFAIDDPPIVKVETTEEALALVDEQAALNPDFIKIWYINLPYLPADSSFDMMQAVVEHAHDLDLPVAIHATELNTAKLAIRAGGDYLVHSVAEPIDEEFIALCLEHDIVLSPSLKVSSNYDVAFSGNLQPTSIDYRMADPFVLGTMFDTKHLGAHPSVQRYAQVAALWARDNVRRDSILIDNLHQLHSRGVMIATGTDAGNIGTFHTASYFPELDRMQAAGMDNAAILKSSTYLAAKAAGKDQLVGQIAQTLLADLIILEENPLEDIEALQHIQAVVKSGQWIDPKELVPTTPEVLAQQQLNAYNARDIDAFLAPYADDVKIYNFPDELSMEGKEAMHNAYSQMFDNTPDLHCKLLNRIVQGNTVIDHEEVTISKDREPFHAVAIYKIALGRIQEVYFVR